MKHPKTNYTIHIKVGKRLAERLGKVADAERRTAHNLAVLILEDGVTQKESQIWPAKPSMSK